MVTITAFYCIARGLSSMKADKFSGLGTPKTAGKCAKISNFTENGLFYSHERRILIITSGIFAEPRRKSGLIAVVNLPAVSGVHNIDYQTPVVHGINYPVVADAETEQPLAFLSL